MEKENINISMSSSSMSNSKRLLAEMNVEMSEKEALEEAKVKRRRLSNTLSTAKGSSEMGIIEEIYCENFMCHHKMRVQLSPNINFITGENGSGKSAIVAALQICLGSNARNTKRGTSMSGLIRREHTGNALVRITLLNDDQGQDAFRYEEYGNKIIIERIIHRNGSSDYRMKNEEGTIISRAKKDLDAMLDHLNIQVDNPCAVLDQESAKLFLKGNAKDKYKFFLKSTDLYAMNSSYMQVHEALTEVMAVKGKEELKLTALQRAYEEAEKKLKDAQELEKIGEMTQQVKHQLIWAFVEQEEMSLDALKSDHASKTDQLSILNLEMEKCSEVVANITVKQQTKNADADTIQSNVDALDGKIRTLKRSHQEARRPMSLAKTEEKNKRSEVIRVQGALHFNEKHKKKAIDDYNSKHAASRGRNDNLTSDIEHTESAVAAHQQTLGELESSSQEMQRQVERKLDEVNEHSNHAKSMKQKVIDVQSDIAHLNNQKANHLAKFGKFVPSLLREIANNKRSFQTLPIGPLGMHIQLPEEHKWMSRSIYKVVGNKLSSFLVANDRDRRTLDGLKKKLKIPASDHRIIICKFVPNRYLNVRMPQGELAAHAMCNVLNIDNAMVFNAIIDTTSFENYLVFRDRQEAEANVFLGPRNNSKMPTNVSRAYLENGGYMALRKGSPYTVPDKSNFSRSPFENGDPAHEISNLTTKLHQLQEAYKHSDADLRNIKTEHAHIAQEQRAVEGQKSQILQQLRSQRRSLEDLHARKAESEFDSTIDLSSFEEKKIELDADLAALNCELQEVVQRIAGFVEDNSIVDEIENARDDKSEMEQSLQLAMRDVTDICSQLTDMKTKLFRVERQHQPVSSEHASGAIRVREQTEKVRVGVEKALSFTTERIAVDEDPDYYRKRVADLTRRAEQERNRLQGVDLEDLRLDMAQKEAKFSKMRLEFETVYENAKCVGKQLRNRQKRWEKLRKEIASRTNMSFNKHLNERDFAGKLKFNDELKQIDVEIMHGRNQSSASCKKANLVKDMKSLSGGERSYTQTALLLALGTAIECPFRVMDEFDVFMDTENRQLTLETLISGAKKDLSKQYIFVTPNDLSTLQRDDLVKIQKMKAPRS